MLEQLKESNHTVRIQSFLLFVQFIKNLLEENACGFDGMALKDEKGEAQPLKQTANN